MDKQSGVSSRTDSDCSESRHVGTGGVEDKIFRIPPFIQIEFLFDLGWLLLCVRSAEGVVYNVSHRATAPKKSVNHDQKTKVQYTYSVEGRQQPSQA